MSGLQDVAMCPWCDKPFIKKDVRQRFCNRNHSSYYSRREKQKREKAEAVVIAEAKSLAERQEAERIEALELQISKWVVMLRGFAPKTATMFEQMRDKNGADCTQFALKLCLTALHEVTRLPTETTRQAEKTV